MASYVLLLLLAFSYFLNALLSSTIIIDAYRRLSTGLLHF